MAPKKPPTGMTKADLVDVVYDRHGGLTKNEAAEIVRASADKDANIIFGTVIDEKMSGEVKITVVATGFVVGAEPSREIEEQYSRPAPVEDVPVYKGFDPSNLDIPAFLRGRR